MTEILRSLRGRSRRSRTAPCPVRFATFAFISAPILPQRSPASSDTPCRPEPGRIDNRRMEPAAAGDHTLLRKVHVYERSWHNTRLRRTTMNRSRLEPLGVPSSEYGFGSVAEHPNRGREPAGL